jgi:SAM-dependent methyltransferase
VTVRQVLDGNPGYLPEHRPQFDRIVGLDTTVTVARCPCGFHFGGEAPDDELLAYDYGVVNTTDVSRKRVYEVDRRRIRVEIWAKLLALYARPLEGVRAVDFGCGWGDVLAMIRSPGVSVIGVEQNETQVAFARAHGVEVRADVSEIEPASVDFVLSNQVLEHVADPRAVLTSLRRLMRDGALAFFSVPDFSRFDWKAAQRTVDSGGSITRLVNPWEHLNYFDRRSFAHLLEETGFRPEPASLRDRAETAARLALRRATGIEAYCRVD